MQGARSGVDVSVVIPVYNERESVGELFRELDEVLKRTGKSSEVIFVDDGSRDGTEGVLRTLACTVITFVRNSGKTQALRAGFAESRGDIVFTLDGDLQDDPCEIPAFLQAVERGADLVCGWKQKRQDPFEKKFFSKIANSVARFLARSPVHDMNCGFKAYKREVVENLSLYGDMHRYIPPIVAGMGFRVVEIPVQHRARRYGSSKYGAWRLVAGLLDLLTLLFTQRFFERPAHFFGLVGGSMVGVGTLVLLYLSVLRIFYDATIGSRPLLLFGVLLVVVGFQSLSLGLLGELIVRRRADVSLPVQSVRRI